MKDNDLEIGAGVEIGMKLYPFSLLQEDKDFMKSYKKWVSDKLTKLSSLFMEKEVPVFLENESMTKQLIIQFDNIVSVGVSIRIDKKILVDISPIIPNNLNINALDELGIVELFKRTFLLEFIQANERSFIQEVLNCAFSYLYAIFKFRVISYKESKESYNNLQRIALKSNFDVNGQGLQKLNELFNKNGINFFKQINTEDFDIFI